jgi:hypothetical protein
MIYLLIQHQYHTGAVQCSHVPRVQSLQAACFWAPDVLRRDGTATVKFFYTGGGGGLSGWPHTILSGKPYSQGSEAESTSTSVRPGRSTYVQYAPLAGPVRGGSALLSAAVAAAVKLSQVLLDLSGL